MKGDGSYFTLFTDASLSVCLFLRGLRWFLNCHEHVVILFFIAGGFRGDGSRLKLNHSYE